MHVNWSKLDNALGSIYHSYLDYLNNPNDKRLYLDPIFQIDKEKIFISILFTGKKELIERLGFQVKSIESDHIIHGFIYYKDLAEISQLSEVQEMHYGSSSRPVLVNSVVDIKAKKTLSSLGIWEMTGISTNIMDPSNPVIVGNGGENVIIGIIDTGIDWTHENFRELTGNTSRILRIWDQGLVVHSGESSPQASYTNSGQRYGVEYTDTAINADLPKQPNQRTIRHKDKDGHGTHVAGIAAGNGRAAANILTQSYEYAGVAPLAKIVVVKFLNLDRQPTNVSEDLRFKDAITYINKVGEELGLPVVINCSFGHPDCPHDGYSDSQLGQQEFLYSHYTNQPQRACVFAIANNGGTRYYSKVTIPASGVVEIDLKLVDTRTRKVRTEEFSVSLYYSASINGLLSSVKVPTSSTFSPTVSLGNDRATTYNVNKRYRLSNHTKNTIDKNGQPLSRNKVNLAITPHNNIHKTGDYKLKIEGPAGTIIHMWSSKTNADYGFIPQQPVTLPSNIEFSENSNFFGPSDTENIITVAAYNPTTHIINEFSSHGQIVSYTNTPAAYSKPEVAAPGSQIMSAKSSHKTLSLSDNPSPDEIGRYIDELFNTYYTIKQGTSMAAPHISGLVALMLSKNTNLTMQQIKDLLRNNSVLSDLNIFDPIVATTRVPVNIEAGAGKVNALNTFNNVPTP